MWWLHKYQMSLLQLMLDQQKLAMQTAVVVNARTLAISRGIIKPTETFTMFWEKPMAASESFVAALKAFNRKAGGVEIARSGLKPYVKRTGSNSTRLSRHR